MVLIVDNKQQETFPESTIQLFKAFPTYQETARTFSKKIINEIGPKGLLYVGQCEFALSVPEDKNVNIIGSDDATTCIIVILRHSKSGATALVHFDGTDMEEVISTMIKKIEELSIEQLDGKIKLQLIGGYSDERCYSEEIFYNIMRIFQSYPKKIYLSLACVGDMNTVIRNGIPWPIIYGAGIELKTGEIFPAKFPYKGPEEEVRHARLYSSNNFAEIYDSKKGIFKINPFTYKYTNKIDYLLSLDDSNLLQNYSMSPLVEPPHFVEQARKMFNFIKNNPDITTVFKKGQPHYFKRNEDCTSWIPVEV